MYAVRTRKERAQKFACKTQNRRQKFGCPPQVPSHVSSILYMTPEFLRIILQGKPFLQNKRPTAYCPFCKTTSANQLLPPCYNNIKLQQHNIPIHLILPPQFIPVPRGNPTSLALSPIHQFCKISSRRRALQLSYSATSQSYL